VPGAPIPYSVAKSALNSYVLNQSKMFGKYKIRINAIAPGNIIFDSSTWQKKIKAAPNRIKKYIKENVSLNILGKPNDISNLVVYLASDDAKYITGSIFKVDGGQIRGY
jgi:NAD(P)-dependent dehydrogenase (short-subunit alcohol dehydrogenase family)